MLVPETVISPRRELISANCECCLCGASELVVFRSCALFILARPVGESVKNVLFGC